MEDSVSESEIKREIERRQGDREEEEVPRKRDEEEIMEGGFISQFISKSREIYEGRKDGVGKMEEEGEEETHSGDGIIDKISNFFHQENGDVEKEKEIIEEVQVKVEEEGEEKKKGVEELDSNGGGVINNLISNFFHQNESEEREAKRGRRSEEVGEDLNMEGGGGGGRINNLISNFFHQKEGDGEGEGGGLGEKGTNSDQEVMNGKEQEPKMKKEGENGGIINNLVSNLTASLPEDTVPASDEASILIHSIIHD